VRRLISTDEYAAAAKSLRDSQKQLGLLDIDVKERYVFHTTGNADVIPLVAASNLRPSNCAQCKKGGKTCTDPGW
jgi:hypothetical protein